MSILVEQLTEEELALSSDARALLADRLMESLDPLSDDEIHRLWAVEAIRRRDEVRAGKIEPIPAEVAAERARALYFENIS